MAQKSEMKISTIVNLWLDNIEISVEPSTYATYYCIVNNHIIKKIGDLDRTKLNKKLLDSFIRESYTGGRIDHKGGLSAKTIADISSLLTSITRFAYENGYIANEHFKLIKPKQNMREIKILTDKDQEKLEQYISNHFNYQTAGILLCLYSGMRIGELCALKVEDIDFNKGVLRINKTMQRIKNMDKNPKAKTKISINSPKSKKPRYIPIPSFIKEKIVPIYKGLSGDCYILTGSSKYIEPRSCRNMLARCLRESNIEEINFHALRHTFATRCIEAGMDIKTLSEILGHSSVGITLSTYVHSSYELKSKQMEKLQMFYEQSNVI